MELAKWILEELEDMPLEMLADAVESKSFKPLLINDGHIIGYEKAETPGAATPRESK
ncbi:hypothetical protein [Lacrimispora saccharolytica]|uniref:Tetratricopeptide TPR_2 repeat protein n=1 Tax=Lacrimispora saccharolytica (strain ATCC 35040 / DSM 2544 / NRCC 2533 / WM1) TaxID=610130 RepID=D9R8Z2_LACSW|nr:hypothetical protein [Lacrimispora saccharolytica]ADL03967.1 tetratricopeptide TPR_2 repeat protein [[Clostridium] saccharolyticum WM1]QRV21727.1 hypothetical protein I6K70_09940 [Lacrimispora saccharolytica]